MSFGRLGNQQREFGLGQDIAFEIDAGRDLRDHDASGVSLITQRSVT